MTTYSRLRADIAEWTNNQSTELADQLDKIIDLGELRLVRDADLRVYREHKIAEILAGDPYVYTPADCLVVRALRLIGGEILRLRPEGFLREFWPNELLQARPKYYGHWDASFILLAPTPNDSLEIEITSTRRPEGLDVDTATTWLSTHAYDALLFACLVEAGSYLEGVTPERFALYQGRYQEALARLQGQENRNLVDEY